MNEAFAYDPKTKGQKIINAFEYAGYQVSQPKYAKRLQLYSLTDTLPLKFRPAQKKVGNEKDAVPCFELEAGFGPKDHIFHRAPKTLAKALDDGQKIVLSLNLNLSHLPVDFESVERKDEAQGAVSLKDWMPENFGNYYSISIKSVEDAVKVIRTIHDHPSKPKLNDRVFAVYRGGILPYNLFYLGDRQQDLNVLYENLQSGFDGVAVGETRMIGFPRLFRFMPTKKTLSENGREGLKGNFNKNGGHHYLNRLIFSEANMERAGNPVYQRLNSMMQCAPEGVLVLACPAAAVNRNVRRPIDIDKAWNMTLWIITDPVSQMMPAGKFGPKPRTVFRPQMTWHDPEQAPSVQ